MSFATSVLPTPRSLTIRSALLALLLLPASAQNPSPSATYHIAGTVVSSKGGAHLPQARMFITDVKDRKNIQSQLTTDDGHFDFPVPAGKYALRGAKRGYISADYNQHEQFSTAIVTGAGLDTENLALQLAPTAILFGKVLDENGDPVRQATVTLWREDHGNGLRHIQRFGNEVSDDQGSYEFAPLDAGTYFLSVSARPWYAIHPPTLTPENSQAMPVVVDRSLDVVYPTTYYAGATESEDATPIPVRGGDRQELELRLLPVPAVHVTFRTGQKENEGAEANVNPYPELRKRVFDDVENYQNSEMQSTTPGVVEMTMAPGKYTLRMNGPQGAQASDVDISQDHPEVDASSGEPMGNINVSVHMPDDTPIPPQLFLGLLDQRGRGVVFQQVSAQGEAQFAEVPPGTYEFSAGGTDRAYWVVRTISQGRTTSGPELRVAPGTSAPLDLYLAAGNARVEGVAQQDGKPVAGAMVVLVPKHPESNRGLFRRDQTDLDGTFTLQPVVPGTYSVIAIADGWDLDWSQPSVIAHYTERAQTIEVPAHTNHPLKLPQPVEVQPK